MSTKCGCNKHHEVCQSYPQEKVTFSKLKSRVHPKKIIEELIDKQLISPRATYICSVCAKHALEEGPPSKKYKYSDHTLYSMDDFFNIVNQRYPVEILSQLAEALGKSQYAIFGQNINDALSAYRHTLTETTAPVCSNPIIDSFLKGLCCEQYDPTESNDMRKTLVIESIAHLRNQRYVGPQSFVKSALLYLTSHSKAAINVLAKDTPYASYPCLIAWLEQQGKFALETPKADLISFINNNQIVGRTNHIKIHNKVPSSTITTAIHIQTEGPTIQQEENLSPRKWLADFEMQDTHWRKMEVLHNEAEQLLGYDGIGLITLPKHM